MAGTFGSRARSAMRDRTRIPFELRPSFFSSAQGGATDEGGAVHYSLELRLGAPLMAAADCDFVDLYKGDVLAHDESFRPSPAGRFRASVVRVEEADARG